MHGCVALSLLLLLVCLQPGLPVEPASGVEISITHFFSCTWFGTPEDCFPMDAPVYFNISLVNLTIDPKSVTLDISVLDCTNVPIGLDQLCPTLPPTETSQYIMSVFIPRYARLGIATAYASVFLAGWLVDTENAQFKIDPPDVVPPVVAILSPEHATYGSSAVPLTIAVDERPFWAGYSLNGEANVTLEGNLTLTSLVNGQYNLVVYASDPSGNVGFSQVFFTVLVIHDIAVIDFSCTPQEVFAGQLVSISVSVQNQGTVAETFNVSILVDNLTIETVTVTDLSPGNNTELYLPWNTTGMIKGDCIITSSACPVPGEVDTEDNISADRTVTILTRPDIAVANVAILKAVVGQGYPGQLNVTVMNQGDRAETFDVSVYADSELVHTETVTLAGRTSIVAALSWVALNVAKGTYSMTVIAEPVPNEIDTADNTCSGSSVFVTIPGDVNGDRRVNIFDIVLVASLYMTSQAEDPRYNPNCDIEGDGDVDLFDMVLAAGHYGEVW
jgi:hypothetical protein